MPLLPLFGLYGEVGGTAAGPSLALRLNSMAAPAPDDRWATESEFARNTRLVQMLHSTPTQLVDLLRPPGARVARSTSLPDFQLSVFATPGLVRHVMRQVDTKSVPKHQRKPPLPPQEGPSLGIPRPSYRMPPTYKPPPRRSNQARPTVVKSTTPPPAPLDRMYTRGVQRRLDEIQANRTPLHERLIRSPGYNNMHPAKQRRLRMLVEAQDPMRYNYGNARALDGQTLREVVMDLNLLADSSLRVEMQVLAKAERLREKLHRIQR